MEIPEYDEIQFQVNPNAGEYVCSGGEFRSPPCPLNFVFFSVVRRRSIWSGRFTYDDPTLVRSHIVAREREEWTEAAVAEQHAAMGVPEHPDLIQGILAAVATAVPGMIIDVVAVAPSEVLIDDYDDVIDMIMRESIETAAYRANVLPASKSVIEGLEKVGTTGCSELQSQHCSICMESLIEQQEQQEQQEQGFDIGNLYPSVKLNDLITDPADLGLGVDDLLDHETDDGCLSSLDDPEHDFQQFRGVEKDEDAQYPTRKRKIEHDDDDDDDDYDDYETPLMTTITRLPCSHHYHTDCIVHWLEINYMCPLCRMPVGETSNS